MKLESLQCNNCGADIEVSASTRFVTCAHCGGKLTVVRTESAVYTELAEKVSALSDRMETHLNRVERQNELTQLDREWELERESYMVANKDGAKHIPTRSESAIAGTVITIFGVFWTAMALGITGGMSHFGGGGFGLIGVIFPAFGVLFVALGIYSSLSAYDKATRYEGAKERYETRRRTLLDSDEKH